MSSCSTRWSSRCFRCCALIIQQRLRLSSKFKLQNQSASGGGVCILIEIASCRHSFDDKKQRPLGSAAILKPETSWAWELHASLGKTLDKVKEFKSFYSINMDTSMESGTDTSDSEVEQGQDPTIQLPVKKKPEKEKAKWTDEEVCSLFTLIFPCIPTHWCALYLCV